MKTTISYLIIILFFIKTTAVYSQLNQVKEKKLSFISYSQNDPCWACDKFLDYRILSNEAHSGTCNNSSCLDCRRLGIEYYCNATIGSNGCYLTCLSMVLASKGATDEPGNFVNGCNSASCSNSNNIVTPKSFNNFIKNKYKTNIYNQFTGEEISRYKAQDGGPIVAISLFFPVPNKIIQAVHLLIIKRNIDEQEFVLANVFVDDLYTSHCILIYGYKNEGTDKNDFYVYDPWKGTYKLLSDYKSIYTLIYFASRKHTISGAVKDLEGNTLKNNTVVHFSNGLADAYVDNSYNPLSQGAKPGYYEKKVPYHWSGTITPECPGYTFDPPQSEPITKIDYDLVQNFTGKFTSYFIKGCITASGINNYINISKIPVSFKGANGSPDLPTVYTDINGNYKPNV